MLRATPLSRIVKGKSLPKAPEVPEVQAPFADYCKGFVVIGFGVQLGTSIGRNFPACSGILETPFLGRSISTNKDRSCGVRLASTYVDREDIHVVYKHTDMSFRHGLADSVLRVHV